MNKDMKIHYLAKELIPFYQDTNDETKKILEEHYNHCRECKKNLEMLNGVTDNINCNTDFHTEEKISPFRGLVVFKLSIFVISLIVRITIIGIITYNLFNNTEIMFPVLVSNLILFYFPIVGIMNIITFLFYRNKWFWIVLVVDIIVLLFLDDFLNFF